ncbi:hypothetical protein HZC34_01010 [Candidatus Saganbacteria bacterium]|nr:hypothetical protein [Candidatus Saganbacteria bacterium]
MTPSELSERRQAILEAIVRDFVDTAEPIGSFAISRHYLKDVSPATVRNEMKELEQTGYITHPHTSSGRIPTDNGYRYYVDNIMETKNISGHDISLIKNGIKKIGSGIEDIAHGTVKLLASILNYAAVFVSFGKKKVVQAAGISNMLKHPEFQKIDYARHVVETVEREDMIARAIYEYSKASNITIKIGNENQYKDMKDMSIVVVKYDLQGMEPGAIGIVGPTRMEYAKVKSVLNCIGETLNG